MNEDRLNLPFVGIPTFLRSPIRTDLKNLDADIAFLGIPSDEGSPWYPGARMAPRVVREMSVRFAEYGAVQQAAGIYDIDTDKHYLQYERRNERIVDCGDVDILYTNPAGTFANISDATSDILQAGAIPVVFGGDHAVSYGVVRAYEEPVSVVHFDAHLDYRPFVHGVEYANGSPMLKIGKLPHVRQMVQVGTRSIRTSKAALQESLDRGNDVVTVNGFRDQGVDGILRHLPAGGKVYVSIDIDVLDLPLVPGCASAEPEGFRFEEMRQMLFAIARHADVVGLDVVEINPMLDVRSNNTSLLGAQLAVETIGRVVEQPAYLARKGRTAQ
ncbi:arginase family protein [Microlunatus soli]|uniref:Agmatinase n=1 Tax=Microlunatus soli TaxID=630515 RepID=A0A1H1YIX9_9ACTN|nr:arginase family protein [Microlunatus soli]SDT21420.1 agmatinase [Microlunatus soli]